MYEIPGGAGGAAARAAAGQPTHIMEHTLTHATPPYYRIPRRYVAGRPPPHTPYCISMDAARIRGLPRGVALDSSSARRWEEPPRGGRARISRLATALAQSSGSPLGKA